MLRKSVRCYTLQLNITFFLLDHNFFRQNFQAKKKNYNLTYGKMAKVNTHTGSLIKLVYKIYNINFIHSIWWEWIRNLMNKTHSSNFLLMWKITWWVFFGEIFVRVIHNEKINENLMKIQLKNSILREWKITPDDTLWNHKGKVLNKKKKEKRYTK